MAGLLFMGRRVDDLYFFLEFHLSGLSYRHRLHALMEGKTVEIRHVDYM
jgi:hypothetical protein